MVQARTLSREDTSPGLRHRSAAQELAAAMPRLVVQARRTSATVMHGLHGRRRAGTGENFWQFRRFASGEPGNRIDWRRSARGENLFVREHEWEAAHTVWIWIDRSRSMTYRSSLAEESKVERAVVIGLALADLLVRGGERVGLLGLGAPSASRQIIEVLAQRLLTGGEDEGGLPPRVALPGLSEALAIGDFLAPEDEIAEAIGTLAGNGARGHILALSDPVEESFPFSGRTEFVDPESAARLTFGRAQDLRQNYADRLAAHRAAIDSAAAAFGWSSARHITGNPATEALLALHARLSERVGTFA
ncbi:DUF58 domain-containing protein [Terrihabitans sp. B22-R8]|uniref:DUF58 domain-containing protein n=1 Tax=Terrihabitans sp. B22-R8 TaxID=3425128 RepID=UPI00403D46AD